MAGRYFAIVPAAGSSSRMGEPKLVLPVDGQPLIARTLVAWERSRINRVVVVVRPGDDVLRGAISKSKVESRKSKVEVVVPSVAPVDMKASIQVALQHIGREHEACDEDAFLVAPADMPRLSTAIVDRLIERHATGAAGKVIVPTLGGQKGHPVMLSWSLAGEVFGLKENEGLNAIVDGYRPVLVPCEDLVAAGEYPFADVDTRQEYEGILGRASGPRGGSLH
jgi:molybdenum cofactor cytidylyltransferase